MRVRWLLLVAVSAGVFCPSAGGDDWPQWRGPQRSGVSKETGLLKDWPPQGPKLVWQVKNLDFGYSTPAVAGGRLYLLSNRGLEDEFVQARDVKDGKPVWSTRLGKVGNPDQQPSYPGARSTPTVDGTFLYALGSDGDLVCLEIAGGKPVWARRLRADFGGQPGRWAYAESPLIDGDVLVCTPGGAEATMVALNKKTGGVLWKSAVPGADPAAYASAIVAEVGGVKQYVQFLEKGVVGVEAKTGKFLWRYDRTSAHPWGGTNIATPVFHDGCLYSAGGHNRNGGLVRLRAGLGTLQAEPQYFEPKLPTSMGGAVLVGDHLYGTGGAGLICAEFATGRVIWHDRRVGPGSICSANGRRYVHGFSGQVVLVEATPEGYREKGRFTPPDQPEHDRAWEYPVVANGRLYVRDLGTLWCYDVRDPEAVR